MKKQTIAQLKQLYTNGKFTNELVEKLRRDQRKGVQVLVNRYEKDQRKQQTLETAYFKMCAYENKLINQGYHFIAGVDEAGRGPLAGPVVAAAVILPADFKLLGLNDSKKLTAKTRNMYCAYIKQQAVSYGISVVHNDEIDRINIFEATKIAMHKALNQLDPAPTYALIDAVELQGLPYKSRSIIKGDATSVSIAAASIIAKVTRDRLMEEMHEKYPLYDFKSNMGYGTKHHLERLTQYGPSPIHRQSFAPVRKAIYS
ncbi:MAG TPA: ribonuclease HII [Bacillota bacterium]